MYDNQSRFNRGRKTHFRSRPSYGKMIKGFNPVNIINRSPQTSVSPQYLPKHKFEDFQIDQRLKNNVIQKEYNSPTAIQDQAIPHILQGSDLIGIANTGTGKTASFLIPLIDKVLKNRGEKILIIAPTRELASQIQDDFIAFSKTLGVYSVLCIGGNRMFVQKNNLRRNYNFIIGTPGRIKDLTQQKSIDLSTFGTVVLDEADHMLDIGFIHTIKYLISLLPKLRQSLFFSATIDGKVKDILTQFVNNPITVSVKKQDITENVKQDIIKVPEGQNKVEMLHNLLVQQNYVKVLIFGRTKWGVQKLSDELYRRGLKTGAIHGNKNQNQRQKVLDQFKQSEIQILLATDVASRGLDIPNVSHVINYDLPATYEDYIHRIGRTGRASSKGKALTFV